ncbi:MAG: hypothetical protein WCP21_05715 [Armatimonadota bacterium]
MSNDDGSNLDYVVAMGRSAFRIPHSACRETTLVDIVGGAATDRRPRTMSESAERDAGDENINGVAIETMAFTG